LLAGSLKRKEMVSGRFADAISAMYEISSCLKLYEEKFQNDEKIQSVFRLSILKLIQEADDAMLANIESFPVNRFFKLVLRFFVFPFSLTGTKINDRLIASSAKSVADIEWLLENFSSCLSANLKDIPGHPLNILFQGYEASVSLRPLRQKVKKAGHKYEPSSTLEEWLDELVEVEVLSAQEKGDWLRLNEVVLEALKVDDFKI